MVNTKSSGFFQAVENSTYKEWYLILFLLFFSLSLYTFKLGGYPFFNPDEGIHAEVAKRMVLDGDWITPRFNGNNFYDKPILYYWLNALSFKIFGINEFAARLPAAILGALGVLLTYLLGKTMYDTWTGFMGALILSISFEYLFLSRLVLHDISLTFGIILTLFLFYYGFVQDKFHRWVIPFFYISLAWSVLAKGPLGLILPVLIIGLFILLTREWGLIKEMRLGLGAIIFLPLVATWYVPVSLNNKDFLSYFIFHQHLRQFLSAKAHHNAPVYYYLPALLGGLFPWSCFLPYAWFKAFSPFKKLLDRKADFFLLIWFTVPFIFFSIARSKLNTYILPVYPAAAIMVAKVWRDLIIDFPSRSTGILYPLLVLLSILTIGLIYLIMYYPSYLYLGIVLFTGIAFSLSLLLLKRSMLSFSLLIITPVIIFLSVTIYFMPFFSHSYSTKDLSCYLKQISSPSDHVACYRRVQNSTVFYSDRLIKEVKNRNKLIAYINQDGRWFCTIDEKDYAKNQNELAKKSKIIYREGEHILLTNN